ncbi:hypothetical protein HGA91_03910 [candidate division WWE3 bacterium]|nr:hypothetical protein [candidate division WWE3 bacterium]
MTNTRGFLLLETLAAVVVLGIIGFIIWLQFFSSPDTSNNSPNSPTITTAPHADWLEYKSNTYNYSFKYPSDWAVTISGTSSFEPDGFPYVGKKDGSYQSITFSYFDDSLGEAFSPGPQGYEETKINGITTYITRDAFGGDRINDVYVFVIGEGEYVTALFPVNDPNQVNVSRNSENVLIAEEIVHTLTSVK